MGGTLEQTVHALQCQPIRMWCWRHSWIVELLHKKRRCSGASFIVLSWIESYLDQGAANLEEALMMAERCEIATEVFHRRCVSTYLSSHLPVGTLQSVPVSDNLLSCV